MQEEADSGIRFWGIRCRGCGKMHPTAMHRNHDTIGRFQPDEAFRYKCPRDDKTYDYHGRDEEPFDYHLVWQQ